MAGFISNLFPGASKQDKADLEPPPVTPTTNSFTTPASTPQGSPSKKMAPPGANELPVVFDNLKLSSTNALESPLKLSRPQSSGTPLAPGKTNIQYFDESFADESTIHKGFSSGGGSPQRATGQENTPPSRGNPASAANASFQTSHAALSRQGLYHLKERPTTPAKKFNTSRGLTPEEREILQKPNVKRLVNVTQLCRFSLPIAFLVTQC